MMEARDVYVKFYDSSSDRFYFYNPRTKVSTWKKPKMLGHFDAKLSETSARPKVYAKDLDENDAASMLQSLYRKRLARRHVLQLVENLYVRVKDEKTGKYYYFNKSSGTSSCRREFFSESFLSDFFFFETQGEVLGMHRSVRRFEIYLKMILRRLRVKMMRLIRMRKTRLTLLQRRQFDFNLCGVVITIETEYTN